MIPKNSSPINRWFVGSGLCLLAAPVIWFAGWHPQVGFIQALNRGVQTPLSLGLCLLAILGIAFGYVRGMRGFLTFITLLGAGVFVQDMVSNLFSGSSLQLKMGGNGFFDRFDVYCNDVHLGKTPFLLTEEEFVRRVQPRSTPPDQPYIHLQHNAEDKPEFGWARWTWVPQDVFEHQEQWPPDHQQFNRDNYNDLMQDCRETSYWWRFEQEDCQGIAATANFGSGSFGSTGLTTVYVSPSVEIRSAVPHAQALIDLITEADFEVEEKVIRHILTFRDHLFPEFLKHAKSEPRLEVIFQRAAEVEWDLPVRPTEAESEQILDRILAEIHQRGTFSVPSTTGTAVLRIAQLYPDLIAERFDKLLDTRRSWNRRSGSGDRISWSAAEGPIERVALEYAIRELRLQPASVFNRLFYLSHVNRELLPLVGQYERKEVVELIRHHLAKVEHYQQHEANQLCLSIRNPLLESALRSYLEKNHARNNSRMISEYVLARLDSSQDELETLASWVANLRGLGSRARVAILARIPTPNIRGLVNRFVSTGDRSAQEAVFEALHDFPNPALDGFLIDHFQAGLEATDGGARFSSVVRVLEQTDSPAIRAFVESKLDEGGDSWMRLVKRVANAPSWDWLVPKLAELSERNETRQESAIELLGKIGTDAAWKALEAWPSDAPAADAVKQLLAQREISLRERRQRIEQAHQVVAGELKPDELLPKSTPYIWTESGYQLAVE